MKTRNSMMTTFINHGKIILIVLLIFVSQSNYAQSSKADPLTLNKAIELTIKNYPLIKQQQEMTKAADYKIEQQKSFYYPDIFGQATYTRIGPLPSFSFGGNILELWT